MLLLLLLLLHEKVQVGLLHESSVGQSHGSVCSRLCVVHAVRWRRWRWWWWRRSWRRWRERIVVVVAGALIRRMLQVRIHKWSLVIWRFDCWRSCSLAATRRMVLMVVMMIRGKSCGEFKRLDRRARRGRRRRCRLGWQRGGGHKQRRQRRNSSMAILAVRTRRDCCCRCGRGRRRRLVDQILNREFQHWDVGVELCYDELYSVVSFFLLLLIAVYCLLLFLLQYLKKRARESKNMKIICDVAFLCCSWL